MKRVFAWAAAHLVAACYLLALALWVLWALGNAGWDALGFATGRLTTVEVPLSFGFGHLPPMQITMKLNAKYVPRF